MRASLVAAALLLAFSSRAADLPVFDLADLPPPVAERIAWKNGEALFGSLPQD